MFLIAEETFSSAICLILVWFLVKPYQSHQRRSTFRSSNWVWLPLCFLCSFSFYTFISSCNFFDSSLSLVPTSSEAIFQFCSLHLLIIFQINLQKTSRLMWDITLSAIIVALTSLVIFFFVAPQFEFGNYRVLSIFVRIFNIVCLLYITIHTLRSHLATQDSKTILTPFGYLFLLIGQYSLLTWNTGDVTNEVPFYGGLALRWIGLVLFLLIAYRTFYGTNKRSAK